MTTALLGFCTTHRVRVSDSVYAVWCKNRGDYVPHNTFDNNRIISAVHSSHRQWDFFTSFTPTFSDVVESTKSESESTGFESTNFQFKSL